MDGRTPSLCTRMPPSTIRSLAHIPSRVNAVEPAEGPIIYGAGSSHSKLIKLTTE